jgi:flagellin-like hook-associated protein FlgL
MSGDVSLTSALRNNLLSLQSTQRSIDTTQLRLSTGKRVNSALDNPLNFFRAESFGSRAEDLNTLLDGIALSIRTIEEADAGVTAVLKQLDSAQSLVDQAQTEINANAGSKVIASLDVYTAGATAAGTATLISAVFGDIEGFAAGDSITITLDAGDLNTSGGAYTTTVNGSDTFGALINAITGLGGATVGAVLSAAFNNGKFEITSLDGLGIDSFSISVTDITPSNTTAAEVTVDNTVIGNGKDIRIFTGSRTTLKDISQRYNTTLNEITAIVGDASYQGINLLEGDDLLTTFNEDGSSTLTTRGKDFRDTGLDLSSFAGTAYFNTQSEVSSRSNELSDAIRDVRNFGSTIANDLSVIQTRRDFTESTVSTLRAGADDLTLADLNEEGANLLALQTRQQLGVTSLSLASQSQQAVLRLF